MTSEKVPFALAFVAAAAAAALSASAKTAEVNPAVIASESQPATLVASVPPSNDLRTCLRRLQAASEGDDYRAFKAALEEGRRAVASHPRGGERNAANAALGVFADIGRIWDYAMSSPTGSFFDATAQGGSLLAAMKRYPGYGRSIAGETLTAGDKTFYPTRETRGFLAHESARRLASLIERKPPEKTAATPEPKAPHIEPNPPPKRTPAPVATTKPAAPASGTTTPALPTSSIETDAAAAATVAPEKQNGNMHLILAVVLILGGIGVLVVLFRASD